VLLGGMTSGPPYAVMFANLPSGKYFLSAHLITRPDVSDDLSFDVQPASLRPGNDLWSQAFVVPNAGVVVTGANIHATREAGEPGHFPSAAGRSVWWSWMAGADGVVSATTLGSRFDTVLEVYRGTALSGLSLVGANDDAGVGSSVFSQVTFNAQAGAAYYFAVDGAVQSDGPGAAGTVQLQVVASAPPGTVIVSPVNGAAYVVASPTNATNVNVAVAINDPMGVDRVEYWLDGEASVPLTGTVASPYQWTLTNLIPGDYWLTVMGVNFNGLASVAHAGFSVVSLAPGVKLVDSPGLSPPGFQMAVTGLKGTNYTLQFSSNLTAWGQLKQWTNFPGAERVADTNALPGASRFYRTAFP